MGLATNPYHKKLKPQRPLVNAGGAGSAHSDEEVTRAMESVKRSVIEILEKQGVGDPEHFEAELDSLAFVEFVIELENRFDIRIEETYLVKANFSPLDFVCTHIENLLQEKERQGEDA